MMRNNYSLLALLMSPLVGILTLAAVVIWFFSIQAGESSVERLLQTFASQKISEVRSKLDWHFTFVRKLNEQNAHVFSQELINPNDLDAVQKFLWWQAKHFNVIGYFLFGKKDGDFVDVGNPLTYDRDFITERISREEYGDNFLRSFGIDNQGRRMELLSKPMSYLFQSEPWFSEGMSKKTTFWTNVYLWKSKDAKPQSIAVTSPVFGVKGDVIGRVAIEHRLDQIDQLLSTISSDQNVTLALFDEQMHLIASSSSKGNSKDTQSSFYEDSAIKFSLQESIDNDVLSNFHLSRQGSSFHVNVAAWHRDDGTRWPIVVVLREDAFWLDFSRNKQYAVLATFAAWGGLMLVGVALYFQLVQVPVRGILTAINRAEQGDLSQNLTDSRVREFSSLAKSFDKMLKSLRRTYSELARSKENLERQVQERTHELEKLRADAESQARTDPLTGLANRRAFQELADRAFKQILRNGLPLSLIVLDVDHFKQINDDWGHNVGDQALKIIADVLKENVRNSDGAARVGGEEFAILLMDTGEAGAHIFAERLRLAIMDIKIEVSGACLQMTASFGIAETVSHETDLGKLFGRADKALYHAKNSGRNRVSLASDLYA